MNEREVTAMERFKTALQHKQELGGYTIPYTIDELHSRIAQAEREAADGLGQESEEMFRELDEIFSREEMEVYAWVIDDHIKVYDFWDVRREPNYLVNNNPKNK